MRQLIRWYRESPPRLRVIFRALIARPSQRKATLPPPGGRKRILVVGAANVARSPLAAGLLQQRLDGERWQLLSAGTDAVTGKTVSSAMRAAAAELGVDLTSHRAQAVSRGLLCSADLIITLSSPQSARLIELEPTIQRRVRLLVGFDPRPDRWREPADPRPPATAGREIPDPRGHDFDFHRDCCRRLEQAAAQLSHWVVRRETSGAPATRRRSSAPAWRAVRAR